MFLRFVLVGGRCGDSSLDSDRLSQVAEVVHHVAIREIDFNNHLLNPLLFTMRGLLDGVQQALKRDVVRSRCTLDLDGVILSIPR